MSLVAERIATSSTATAPLLRAIGVTKTYRTPDHIGRLVLENIDFTLREGEIVAMLGKSGAGKSTFLRILAGLLPPSEGRVEYRGQPITGPVRGIAMVFQSFALFPVADRARQCRTGPRGAGRARPPNGGGARSRRST